MEAKRYGLLKDVLNYSTGCVIAAREIFELIPGTKKYTSKNGWQMSEAACLRTEWFEEVKEPERIEVVSIYSAHTKDDSKEAYIKAALSKYPDVYKLREIRKAIESILNDEPLPVYVNLDVKYGTSAKSYTQDQMNQAFEAGRLNHFMAGWKFDTYEDYVKSLTTQ